MMNLHTMRTRAEQRQRAAHQNRAFHREQQEAAEREDQDCKKVIKGIDGLLSAQSAMASIFSEVSAHLLAAIGAESTPKPAPVDERAAGPVAGRDDGAEGTAPVATAEAGPVRDDPVPADRTDGDPVPAAGDDVPADAQAGDDRGTEASGAGEAGKEADAKTPYEAASAAILALIGDRNDAHDMMKSALATVPGKPKMLSEVPAEYYAGLIDLIKSDLGRLQNSPAEAAARKARPKRKPAQSPMAERLVPRPAPYNPIAIGNVREIAPLMNEMRAFFAKCEAKQPGCGIHEVASLEVRFNTTDLRIERALTALAEAGEIEWSASLKGHVTVRALRMVEAAE